MNSENWVNVVVQIEKCICLDCEEEDVNVNSEDWVNASTIHGISSPRLCSEECRCGKVKIGQISKYHESKITMSQH